MTTIREIQRITTSRQTIEGAGVHLRRAIGFGEVQPTDPFLLLDDFRSDIRSDYVRGFPWHPHRGIETITYVLRGDVEHGDSLGNRGVISSGDVQWMTAGSGIIHQEMPKGDAHGAMYGFQLWANLPSSHKMMEPRYRDVKSDAIPTIVRPSGATLRVICGSVDGIQGPVRDIISDPEYLDISLAPGADLTHPTCRGYTVLAYVIQGQGAFAPQATPSSAAQGALRSSPGPVAENRQLVLWADGDAIQVSAGREGVRFLLISGKPIGEPVAWRGPIVMNTAEELRTAFAELERGTFIKHRSA